VTYSARALLDRLRAKRTRRSAALSPAASGDSRPSAVSSSDAWSIERSSPPARPDVFAAVAVGERLRRALAHEWNQLPIEPAAWKAVMQRTTPDLLLLEVGDTGVPGWEQADRSKLDELLSWGDTQAVPTVVWATGGMPPLDVADALVEFARYIFVADPRLVEAWRPRAPAKPVEVLGPAASPQVSNPAKGGPGTRRQRRACVVIEAAGRSAPMPPELADIVVPAIGPVAKEVDVWTVGEVYQLPAALEPMRIASSEVNDVVDAIGQSRVLVHAPQVTAPSLWPIFEAGAAQTAVVTLPRVRKALPEEIAKNVAVAGDQKSLRSEIVARLEQTELRDREAVRLHRAVLAEHTYAHRVGEILARLGMPSPTPQPPVSAVVPTNREQEIDNIFVNLARQSHTDVELVLVAHGLDVNRADLIARARDAGVDNVTVIAADQRLTLGACMNLGVNAASGTYIAKMDDDNFYGSHYLQDLLSAFDYTEAGIVGKWAHYVWLRSSGAVVLRYADSEHAYGRRVQGGSMLFQRDVVRDLQFSDLPRAVDSDILDRAIAAGVKIYSADRFNFVSVRGSDRHAHTWTVADSTFMTRSGQLLFFGDPTQHVEV